MTSDMISFLSASGLAALFYVGLPLLLAEGVGRLAAMVFESRGQQLVVKSAAFLILFAVPAWIAYQMAMGIDSRSASQTPTPASVGDFLNMFLPRALVVGAAYAVIGIYRMRSSAWFSGIFWFLVQVIGFYIFVHVWE